MWLQQGNRNLLNVKSFSSCFKRYRARVLLLRLFSFTVVFYVPHRRYLASCAKEPVRIRTGFFAWFAVVSRRGKPPEQPVIMVLGEKV